MPSLLLKIRNLPVVGALAGALWHLSRGRLHRASVLRHLVGARAFRRHFGPAKKGAGAGKTVLILSVNDDATYRLKLEALMALSLQRSGARCIILLRDRSRVVARALFRLLGIRDFLYLDDIRLDDAELAAADRAAGQLLGSGYSFPIVKAWLWEGSNIGIHTLSTLTRSQTKAPDLTDPDIRRAFEAMVPEVAGRILQAKKLARTVRIDLAIVVEANYAQFGPVVDALVSAPHGVVQIAQLWREDALTMRRLTPATRRQHPASVSRDTLERLDRAPWTATDNAALERFLHQRYDGTFALQSRNQPDVVPMSREDIVTTMNLDPAKPIAVVFSHILWDANLFYGDDLYDDYEQWFVETVRIATRNPNANWLIKLHPANIWKRALEGMTTRYGELVLIEKHIGPLPDHVKVLLPDTKVCSLSLFVNADAGVTVRGTVGVEMPCFGKPVVTAGTGRYSGLGFTIDPSSREDYERTLASLHTLGPLSAPAVQRARRHALAAFRDRQWRMQSFRFSSSGNASTLGVASDLVPIRAAGNAPAPLEDVDRFAAWALGTVEVDYVELP
jgi:hypothetical protein